VIASPSGFELDSVPDPRAEANLLRQIVTAGFQQQRIDECKVALDVLEAQLDDFKLTVDQLVLAHQQNPEATPWYIIPYLQNKLLFIENNADVAVTRAMALELSGAKAFYLAASIRILLYQYRKNIPGLEEATDEARKEAAEDFHDHHQTLRELVLDHVQTLVSLVSVAGTPSISGTPPLPAGHIFTVNLAALSDMYGNFGLTKAQRKKGLRAFKVEKELWNLWHEVANGAIQYQYLVHHQVLILG